MAMFSPAAAAKKAGVSRSLISRALKEGSLKGIRKNNQHWSILDTDLDEWMERTTLRAETEKLAPEKAVPQTGTRDPDDAAKIEELTRELSKKSEELADVKARLEVTKESLVETKNDRDAWKEQAQQLASNNRSGFFRRLFGG